MRPLRDSLAFAAPLLAACVASSAPLVAAPAKLALAHQRLELPGVPVESFAVDLDRDGRRDLVVVVASTSWGEVGIEEPMQVDAEGTFVDVLTVVPTVLDRRELLFFRGTAGLGFAAEAVRLELPPSVHAIEAGPASAPLVAWTDDGVAEIVLAPASGEAGREGDAAPVAALELVPRIAARTLFSGSSSFIARSGLVADLDGDGSLDLFVPAVSGLAVHLSTAAGFSGVAASVVAPPREDDSASASGPLPRPEGREDEEEESPYRQKVGVVREVLLPVVLDLNGDRLPDLLYRAPQLAGDGVRVRLNLGEGLFGPAFDPLTGWDDEAEPAAVAAGGKTKPAPTREVAWLGDLDGDGQAEVVTALEIPSAKDTMRAELAEAKRPHARISVHSLGADAKWDRAPKAAFTVEGYVFEGGGGDDGGDEGEGGGFSLPSGVLDLDGDGKLDLVALSLDFSLFEAMRVLTTKSIKLGLDFGIYRQGQGLSFRPVPDLDLAGELRLRLDSLALGQLSSFAGDFDGDGRADFVQLGRGKKVTIHRGQPGALYAREPDLAITLEREPLDVALVAVNDLDGDGRSDLCVTQPIGGKAIGARAAFDLYLSGGAR